MNKNKTKIEMSSMTLNEQFDLENNLEYMRSMRDAWEREAEALRTAMIKWSRRAHDAERELERVLDAATHIQTHMRKPAKGGTPTLTNVPLPVKEHQRQPKMRLRELTPSSCDPMEAKGARLALEQEEQVVMEKPFREVLRELHDMLIKAKEDSPEETGTWQERQVREQARRIAKEADEVVDSQCGNRTIQGGSRNACLIPHDTRPIPQQCCSRCV